MGLDKFFQFALLLAARKLGENFNSKGNCDRLALSKSCFLVGLIRTAQTLKFLGTELRDFVSLHDLIPDLNRTDIINLTVDDTGALIAKAGCHLHICLGLIALSTEIP